MRSWNDRIRNECHVRFVADADTQRRFKITDLPVILHDNLTVFIARNIKMEKDFLGEEILISLRSKRLREKEVSPFQCKHLVAWSRLA